MYHRKCHIGLETALITPNARKWSYSPSLSTKGHINNRLIHSLAIFCFLIIALAFLASSCEASTHFKASEFQCKHCGKVKVSPVLIAKLEALRAELGNTPIVINSGYRCPIHNKAVGGVKNSQHTRGTAADIRVKHYTPAEVGHFARMVGFGYVKVYKTFVHVDIR